MALSPSLLAQSNRKNRAFTLVEIMIVVVIIGVLASMAIPGARKMQRAAQTRRFMNDLRVFSQAFETHALQSGAWPADSTPGILPTEMASEIHEAAWSGITSLGGRWDYDFGIFGVTAGISVYMPTVDAAQMEDIDRMIDDGDLNTGNFRSRANGYIWVLEF